MNPTNDALEQRLAALEGGRAALSVSSGQAATTFCLLNLAQAGDNFVSSTALIGGTVNLFTHTLKKLGIEVRYADPSDPKNFEKLIDDRTRAFYAETLPNPYLRVFPIKEVSDIGRKHNIPLIMDNTASPVICTPIEHGAAVVVHSLTKYIGGHGTVIGGCLVDGGNFDWTADKKRQPLFNEPDASYGGAVWGEVVPQLTGANVAFAVRSRVVLLRDLGAPLAPDNAFGIIQGLETVPLRMKQHCLNAEKVVKFLSTHKNVERVIYPTLHKGELANRAKKYFKGGNGSLVGVEVKGGVQAGKKLRNNILLVIDDAYSEYIDKKDYLSGLELFSKSKNVFVTRTFSKAYGLAGLRVGWGYASKEIINVGNEKLKKLLLDEEEIENIFDILENEDSIF